MKKKQGIALALALMLCLGLAGCKNETNEPENGEHEPLTMQTFNIDQAAFRAAVEENCPGVRIEFVSYTGGNATGYAQYMLEKGHPTDIYTVSVFGMQERQREYLLDLSGYEFLNNYNTADINQVTLDGAVYMVPASAAIIGLYYNKTLFTERGWAIPQSFEELKTLIRTIRETGIDPVAAQFELAGNGFFDLFTMAKTDFLSTPDGRQWEQDFKDGKATAAQGLSEAAKTIQELMDCGFLDAEDTERSSKETSSRFFNREAAMYLNAGTLPRFTQNKDGTGDEYGVMPYLGPDENQSVLILQPQRYIGLSKELAEPGNEQKLKDALRVMEFLSTKEGQASLLTKHDNYVTPLKNSEIPKDSPFREVEECVRSGHTSTLAYAGYEPIIVGVGEKVRDWAAGKCTGDDVLSLMDQLQTEYLAAGVPAIATASQDLTLEETAQLQAEALRTAAGTDFGMVSLGVMHGDSENPSGVCGQIFAGGIALDVLNGIVPNFYKDPVCVLTLSGADIRGLLETGFVADEDVEGFPYVPSGLTAAMNADSTVRMITLPDGSLLDEKANYTVAINQDGYTEEVGRLGGAKETEIAIIDAVADYLSAHSPLSPPEPSVLKP